MKTRKLYQTLLYLLSILSTTSLLISCGKEDIKTKVKIDSSEKKSSSVSGSNSAGKELFYMKSNQNNIACADCHSDGTNNANPLTKYFSNIQGANKRTSTFLGKFTGEEVVKNAGGATLCWTEYMRMKEPLSQEQINSLNNYYASVTSSDSPAEIKYETIALPTKDKTKLKNAQNVIMGLKGDPVKGEQDFVAACAFCHGDNSTIKKIPSITEDFEGNTKSITYNVRFGDGAMPFYKNQVLSDQEIADISAYILQKSGK